MISRLLALTITAVVALGSVVAAGCGGESAEQTEATSACVAAVQGAQGLVGEESPAPEEVGERVQAAMLPLTSCPTLEIFRDAIREVTGGSLTESEVVAPIRPLCEQLYESGLSPDDLPLCKAIDGE